MKSRALNLEMTELEALIHAICDELNRRHPDRQITLQIDGLPAVMADPPLLRQLFTNLLSNANKFTRTVSHTRIDVGSELQDGERVYFVRDNGVGFDMAKEDKLFGAFQRFHSNSDFEGTDIGLSIVQRIVQRLGGRIWAQSAPGESTVFI